VIGLEKAVKDIKSEKFDRKFSLVFWIVMGLLCTYGMVRTDTIFKMVCCSGVSKGVKWLMG
jgi:hypothetical protein